MRALAFVVIAALVAFVVFACDGGTQLQPGANEPIRVADAQFVPGDLPGTPLPDDAGQVEAGAPTPGVLAITEVTGVSGVVLPGQVGKK